MKQYKLLKDLPDIKAGTLSVISTEKHYTFTNDTITIGFDVSFMDECPDWFQLVEEKEFTESQVREAINKYVKWLNSDYDIFDNVVDGIIINLRK